MRALALVVVTAATVCVPPPSSDLFASPRLGYTLRIPAGWQASARRPDDVAVITSLRVPNRDDNPERILLPRGGVYIWIAEYRGVRAAGVKRRPARIQLGEKRAHACGFGDGYMLRFADHGRLFQVFVKLGPSTDPWTTLAVLDSLRVTR